MGKKREIQTKEHPLNKPCSACAREGRTAILYYQGQENYLITFADFEWDDAYPGGQRTFDRTTYAPYDIWRCEYGHEDSDGY